MFHVFSTVENSSIGSQTGISTPTFHALSIELEIIAKLLQEMWYFSTLMSKSVNFSLQFEILA
jgi:hypothetical protein